MEPKVHFKSHKSAFEIRNDRKPISSDELTNGQAIENDTRSDSPSTSSSLQLMDEKQHIQLLCDTMKKQIISRAFYGWLAYCRHLKTVRTHLADLVNPVIIRPDDPPGDTTTTTTTGINKSLWDKIYSKDKQLNIDPKEFYRLIYYGGVEHSIRPQVWLYLLEHYKFTDNEEEKAKHDRETRQKYEMIMSDWLAVEAIVRQRDKEIVAANLAKLSSESNNSTSELTFSFDKTMFRSIKSDSNDVFEPLENDDGRRSSSQVETKPELATTTKPEDSSTENSSINRKQLMRHKQVQSVASLCGISSGSLQNIIVTNPSIDQSSTNSLESLNQTVARDKSAPNDEFDAARLPVNSTESGGSQCVSPASSNGGLYSVSSHTNPI